MSALGESLPCSDVVTYFASLAIVCPRSVLPQLAFSLPVEVSCVREALQANSGECSPHPTTFKDKR